MEVNTHTHTQNKYVLYRYKTNMYARDTTNDQRLLMIYHNSTELGNPPVWLLHLRSKGHCFTAGHPNSLYSCSNTFSVQQTLKGANFHNLIKACSLSN